MPGLERNGDAVKVLTVGGGGREHAIVEAVRGSGGTVFSVMKNRNPGIARAAKDFLLAEETKVDRVVAWGEKVGAELAFVGPEAPLGHGLVDRLESTGIPAVGPTQRAAQIELSKEFARDLMRRHRIPGLVEYHPVGDATEARALLREFGGPFVVKPIGLTGGKGVKVMGDHFHTQEEGLRYVEEVLDRRIGGQARVLLERREEGEEFSLQAFTDGEHVSPMPAVQDYKRAEEKDRGPNTGGMGSVAAGDGLLPFLPRADYEAAVAILRMTVRALQAEGRPFKGVLYGGFILTTEGPKVLEFNARFGDPEAMNVLPVLREDFLEVCGAIVEGALPERLLFAPKATVCKYVVPRGYGTESEAGRPLAVDETAIRRTGAVLYYASVDEKDGRVLTTTSRSLALVGVADDLPKAEAQAEAALQHVRGTYAARHDIGTAEMIEAKVRKMKAGRV
ncbi:MAG: phosphoribosylamine--glycine ligase [Thermoplasmata archaeon]